jgi:hypothetical protein
MIQNYTVEGAGSFPIDMLRFDMAWPYESKDSGKIASPPRTESYQINLSRAAHFHHKPDDNRWKSLGWRIVPDSIRQG